MIIQPIVEGHGEVAAVPVLLRRFQQELGAYHFQIARPIRRKRSELVTEEQLRRSVRLALGIPECSGILILFDSDDDCPAVLGPQIQRWAQIEARAIPCEVVLAHREYEAWFLSALESLRNFGGIKPDAISHSAPETIRNCKGALEHYMIVGDSYSPTVDQADFTSRFDVARAYRTCRSFRRITTAFENLVRATGHEIEIWPPNHWQQS
ncbi:MAG TPA: DUF4276 family protein [Candidatus Angelobacter sp.]|nr:DUF4276 family protein [Candidatus Angelobacter sp.]